MFLGDVERTFVKQEAVGFSEAAQGDDALVGYAIAVAVGQGDDLVSAHVGHVQYAVGIKCHKAGFAQALVGEDAGREAGGEIEDQILGYGTAERLGHNKRGRLQAQIDFGD